MGIGGAEDLVPSNLGRDDLADDIAIGKTDDEPVLGGVVLVFGLADESFPCVVVGLSSPAAFILGLIAARLVMSAAFALLQEK